MTLHIWALSSSPWPCVSCGPGCQAVCGRSLALLPDSDLGHWVRPQRSCCPRPRLDEGRVALVPAWMRMTFEGRRLCRRYPATTSSRAKCAGQSVRGKVSVSYLGVLSVRGKICGAKCALPLPRISGAECAGKSSQAGLLLFRF